MHYLYRRQYIWTHTDRHLPSFFLSSSPFEVAHVRGIFNIDLSMHKFSCASPRMTAMPLFCCAFKSTMESLSPCDCKITSPCMSKILCRYACSTSKLSLDWNWSESHWMNSSRLVVSYAPASSSPGTLPESAPAGVTNEKNSISICAGLSCFRYFKISSASICPSDLCPRYTAKRLL